MPAFKFKLAQCVMVPGEVGVQGRVFCRSEFVGVGNKYIVSWLDTKMQLASGVFDEVDLIGAWARTPEPVELQDVTAPKMPLPSVDFVADKAAAKPKRAAAKAKRKSRK